MSNGIKTKVNCEYMNNSSTLNSVITIARDRRFLIVIFEYRYRRKSLYTSIVAGTVRTVKLYR